MQKTKKPSSAYDREVITDEEKELATLLDCIEQFSQKANLTLNRSKYVIIMVINYQAN